VVEFICRLTGYDFSSSVRLIDENFGQDMKFSLDASKARREFGWSQQIGFEDGVKETAEWIESNWNFIRTQPMDYVHKE
jgi:dTDP-glucose 4,6-dehydratase